MAALGAVHPATIRRLVLTRLLARNRVPPPHASPFQPKQAALRSADSRFQLSAYVEKDPSLPAKD